MDKEKEFKKVIINRIDITQFEHDRNTLIEFMDDLRDYVRESNTNIASDNRSSSEFVDVFINKNIDEMLK
jgi:hypothetical protein